MLRTMRGEGGGGEAISLKVQVATDEGGEGKVSPRD